MRIASVYIPSFPLQAALVGQAAACPGQAPGRDGAEGAACGALAIITQPAVGSPVVVACSRAAWSAGVRPGMSATVARTLVPGLACAVADVTAERALLGAVAEALLAVSPRVELGGDPRGQHHMMYAEVPAGKRGSWFGGKVREVLALFGLRGRVGIADDRSTAYVAASTGARDARDGRDGRDGRARARRARWARTGSTVATEATGSMGATGSVGAHGRDGQSGHFAGPRRATRP